MSTEYEYYESDVNSVLGSGDTTWTAQTFTPSISHTTDYVYLWLAKHTGSPGTVTVSIRDTSGGVPTGGDLCSGTFDGSTLATYPSYTKQQITFGTHPKLLAGTMYAIVVRCVGIYDYLMWEATDPGGYTGGTAAGSSDSGANWTTGSGYSSYDCYFEEWGTVSTTDYVLSCGYGTYNLTGQNATIGKVYTILCGFGQYVLTGFNSFISRTGWVKPTKHSTTFTNASKHTTNYVKPTKNPGGGTH
jgi:hypothetical protein